MPGSLHPQGTSHAAAAPALPPGAPAAQDPSAQPAVLPASGGVAGANMQALCKAGNLKQNQLVKAHQSNVQAGHQAAGSAVPLHPLPNGAQQAGPSDPAAGAANNPTPIVKEPQKSADELLVDQKELMNKQFQMQQAMSQEQNHNQMLMSHIKAQESIMTSLANSMLDGAKEAAEIAKKGGNIAAAAIG